MKPEEIIRKGEKAEQIMKNPVYAEAMNAVKERVFNEIRKTGLFHKRKREEMYKLMRAADIFEGELNKYLNDMLVEKEKLKQKKPKRII